VLDWIRSAFCIPATACLGKRWIATNEGVHVTIDSKGPNQRFAFAMPGSHVGQLQRIAAFFLVLPRTDCHGFRGGLTHLSKGPSISRIPRQPPDATSIVAHKATARAIPCLPTSLIMLSDSLRFRAAHFQSRARLWGRNIPRGARSRPDESQPTSPLGTGGSATPVWNPTRQSETAAESAGPSALPAGRGLIP
ncbi:uncharacterized protein PpBr36_09982, partial [Pyricularia pennisetigena]|uniref:uncharacterized protein n=1 Tax=Pyricularia pennisetigena TaxID=1578925 RepID=UPI0011511311